MASHHRGAWERMIRSTRKILESLVKEQTLDDESLQTLMCEAENIINGRPLTAISGGPKDLEPLTLNHLLLLRQEASLPLDIFKTDQLFSRPRCLQVQYLANVFWHKWKREYLPLLEQRQKWLRPRRNLSGGDSVLIVNEKTPRSLWPTGRVSEVYPDSSGFVRRVKVITKKSTLDRPVTKLCLLEQV